MMRRQSFAYQVKNGGYIAWIALAALFLSSLYITIDIYKQVNFSTWPKAELIYFAQLVVIFISAVIAFITIRSSRKTACEVATITAVMNDYQDSDLYVSKMKVFGYIKNHKGTEKSITAIFEKKDDWPDDSDEQEIKKSTMLVLNRHEFFAAAVNAGVLNENLYKRLHCSNVLRVWNELSTVVIFLRNDTDRPTLFLDLEILASRWTINPLRIEDIHD